jgi:hypothetical protein
MPSSVYRDDDGYSYTADFPCPPDEGTWYYSDYEINVAREIHGVAYYIYSESSTSAWQWMNRKGGGVIHWCGNYVWPAVGLDDPWWCRKCNLDTPEEIRNMALIMVGWGHGK